MGPRHWGRGKLSYTAAGLRNRAASMGPRHWGRGKPAEQVVDPPPRRRLQWGHGTGAVENPLPRGPSDFRFLASMGPRHWGRGKPLTAGVQYWAVLKLQWGHGTGAVENRIPAGRGPERTARFNGATAL